MEVTNRFKGLDLIDRVPEELWTEVHDIVQEAGQVIWYSNLFQNFPQFIPIHTVKGFGIVNKAEIMSDLISFNYFLLKLARISFIVCD